ncbi:MAG: alpha/beta hydrolase domain-containing protein [Acidimicrobiales bacterium]
MLDVHRLVRGGGALIAAALLASAGCSGDDDSDDGAAETDTTATTVDRPDGPVADLSEELTGGHGVFLGSPDAFASDGSYIVEVDEPGYVQEEFVASGTASSYVVDGELTADGEWVVEPDQTADYRTRVLVRRPEDPDDFSGVAIVEWLNVSGGVDADAGYTSMKEEIFRQGHAYVGVSAQLIGIEGGPVLVEVDVPGAEFAGVGAKAVDPERYGSLHHPGDAFSFDIYTQVARALRQGQAVGDLEPSWLIASGQSQSAAAMVSYINGVQPLTQAFDAFFVHSRGGSGMPFPPIGESVDFISTLGGTASILRTDTPVPILDVQAENDLFGVLGSAPARQPDSDTFRLWEVAGTAHADRTLVGDATADLVDCGVPINDAPMHVVARAAMRHLVTWVVEGEPPPEGARLEVTEGDAPTIRRDEDGIALGGVRTPPVDVPVEVLSGEVGPGTDTICILSGSTNPLPAARLAELYPSVEDYEGAYSDAVEDAITAGVVLEDDRAAIEGYAEPDLVTP